MKFALVFILSLFSLGSYADSVICEAVHLKSTSGYSEKAKDLQQIIETSGRSGGRGIVFGVTRGVAEYIANFGPEFKKRFEKLTSEEVIVDAGSGDSLLSDALNAIGKGKYIGITFELIGRSISFFENRIANGTLKLFTGRFFESITRKELTSLGPVKIITDFFGVMSYTERPDLVLKKYLDILDKDGAIFIYGPNIQVGNDYSFYIWLRKVKGIQIDRKSVV